MKLKEWVNATFSKNGLLIGAVFLVVGFSWSWLFTSRVAELADSMMAGYLLALLGFVVIVSLTSYVFIKIILYFQRTYFMGKRISFWVLPLLFVVWSAVEYLVSLFSTLVWFGRNGSVDSVLPFASFTPTLSHTPLGYLSRFVGFHGLSAVIVVLIAVCVVKKLRKYALVTFASVIIATFISWACYKIPTGNPVNVLIVAESLSETVKTPEGNYELAVFPEYGLSNFSNGAERILPNKQHDVFYVGSKQAPADKGHKNVLVYGSSNRGVLEQRAKSRLIPGGEYLPYIPSTLLHATNAHKTLDYFELFKAVEKGPTNYSVLEVNDEVRLGSAVCASIISPEDYRRFTKNGATVLTNSASLGIFNSKLFTFQHQGLAKFMATANARPFLQSANDADAFALDHNGNMIARTSPVSTKEVTVTTNSTTTPYTVLGEWPVYIGLIAMATILFKKVYRRKRLLKTK